MPSSRYGISEAERSVDSEADAGETTMDEVSPSHPTAAMPSTPRFAVRILASLLVPLCLAAGCETAPNASGTSAAEAAYRRGDFAAAERLGREAEQSSRGLEREEAAYIAGLGAARLGDLDKAARNLQIAAASADTDLAARANASLGAVERARGGKSADHRHGAAIECDADCLIGSPCLAGRHALVAQPPPHWHAEWAVSILCTTEVCGAEWACVACTLLNAPSDGRCAACDAPRHEIRHRAGSESLGPGSLGGS